jgi:hypothetical protein
LPRPKQSATLHAVRGKEQASEELVRQLRAWSYRRQRLGVHAAESPADALCEAIAVYSSHPSAPLSLLARCRRLDAAAFRALEREGDAVRIPAMRGSIHLVPGESASKLLAATRVPLEKLLWRLDLAGLDTAAYADLKRRVLETAREPISAVALRKALGGNERMMTAVRVMTFDGSVLRLGGGLRSDSLLYVAADAWRGSPLPEADAEESLVWLAREYLRAFGPARDRDFAWWMAIPLRRARQVLAGLETTDIGAGYLARREDAAPFAAVSALNPGSIDLLPKWDAYTMGLAPDGRRRLVDEAHRPLAYSGRDTGGGTMGDGFPLVLRGGRAVGAWSHRFSGDRMNVQATPFPGERVSVDEIAPAAAAVAGLLEATAHQVTITAA